VTSLSSGQFSDNTTFCFFCVAVVQTLLRKMDKRLKKLISCLMSQTLAVVVFAGGLRSDAEANQNAMCFVCVT